MYGIRWIIGLPIGIGIYLGIMHLNIELVEYIYEYAPWTTFWRIETLIVNTFISIYFGIVFAYMVLPNDYFALILNTKVKFIYFVSSFWTVIQLLMFGAAVYDSFHGYFDIYTFLYPIFTILAVWITYNGVKIVDFKNNQPNRDYYESQQQEVASGEIVDI